MALRMRQLTDQEKQYLRELANSPSAPLRVLQRAYIVWLSAQGKRVPLIAREVGVSEHTVRVWLTRFREQGVRGLEDLPRPGAERKYSRDQVAEICRVAQVGPAGFDLPFSYWTLDRLVHFLHAERNITVKRSRLNEILREQAVPWQGTRERFNDAVPPLPPVGPAHRGDLLCFKQNAGRPHGVRRPLLRRPRKTAHAGVLATFPCRDLRPPRSGSAGEPTQLAH